MNVDLFVVFMSLLGIAFFAFFIVIVVVSVKRLNVRLTKEINGHNVEISTGYSYARLSVDGKVVDEMNSYQLYSAKLMGNVDEICIIVNIGNGFMGRRITTFISNEKDMQLSN